MRKDEISGGSFCRFYHRTVLGNSLKKVLLNPLLLTISMVQLFQAITSKGNVVPSAAVERISISPQDTAGFSPGLL